MSQRRAPMRQRPEFADVTPVDQDDGPCPVVSIAYREDFAETMSYFRALYIAGERSPRALALSAEAIGLNAGNYTVWHFRRLVLEALNADLLEELAFVECVAKSHPKNYQIWHHRRWVSEKFGTDAVNKELEFTRMMLHLDGKNYHAWSHRQWVLQALGGWEDELEFCHELLVGDVFNNSAWNQRYFVVTRSPIHGGLRTLRDSETDYAIKAIEVSPENESPWRYLQGLYKGDDQSWISDSRVPSVCLRVLRSGQIQVFALSTLLDLLCHGLEPTHEVNDAVVALRTPEMDDALALSLAAMTCSVLAAKDPMRASYWAWRRAKLHRGVK